MKQLDYVTMSGLSLDSATLSSEIMHSQNCAIIREASEEVLCNVYSAYRTASPNALYWYTCFQPPPIHRVVVLPITVYVSHILQCLFFLKKERTQEEKLDAFSCKLDRPITHKFASRLRCIENPQDITDNRKFL
jgi:hypothetical protein